MPLQMQVKLLRVLQEREFERVGGTETISVNVRVVAATNKDWHNLVKENKFREDLYYRLNVIVIHIPPLRERKEDIPMLTISIIKKFSHLMGRYQVTIIDESLSLFATHHWPGNVRELENAIERAMNSMNNERIEVVDLPDYLHRSSYRSIDRPNNGLSTMEEETISQTYKTNLLRVEKDAIEKALLKTGGNRTAAAKLLGISRSQLYKKIDKFV